VISSRRASVFARGLRGAVAAGSALLILFLATLAASPEMHARFHGAAVATADEGCAITLFANGVSLAGGTIAVTAPAATWSEPYAALAEELFLVASRYLRQPERGPPLS
jgi:hypothetical protein